MPLAMTSGMILLYVMLQLASFETQVTYMNYPISSPYHIERAQNCTIISHTSQNTDELVNIPELSGGIPMAFSCIHGREPLKNAQVC